MLLENSLQNLQHELQGLKIILHIDLLTSYLNILQHTVYGIVTLMKYGFFKLKEQPPKCKFAMETFFRPPCEKDRGRSFYEDMTNM